MDLGALACWLGIHDPEIIAECGLGICGCDNDCDGPEECPAWNPDCGCAPLQQCRRCKATRTWGSWVTRGATEEGKPGTLGDGNP